MGACRDDRRPGLAAVFRGDRRPPDVPGHGTPYMGTRPVEAAYGLMRPTQSVRFCSSHGVIELARAYDEGPLRDAIKLLKNKGVPVDAKLLKWLKIE